MVECHSGHTYAERPAAFWVEGERREVSRIVKEWNDPLGRHFIVEDGTGAIYQLDHLDETYDWQVRTASQAMKK